MTGNPNTAQVYVDIVCPWCYIGLRRLTAALALLPERDRPTIVWRSLELDPRSSRTPGEVAAEAMTRWWGADAPARVARIQALGAADGLPLDLHRARPVNTFDAHRLLQFAAARGRAEPTLEALLRAYHTEGADLADRRLLERVGVASGLPAAELAGVLAGDGYAETVRADRRRAARHGVRGVPSVVVGDAPPVSAVQPAAELARLLTPAGRAGADQGGAVRAGADQGGPDQAVRAG
ncbi:DsbA family oxidoreductase [Plantactinospora sp. WMMB782]|uniref:DsbA family oxidoreductase n=1 Tax=Plantactinospora sp. WMMB782 TaxID=3404121 RepID=UPI003B95E39D